MSKYIFLAVVALSLYSLQIKADGESVLAGTGGVKLNNLLQPWFVTDTSSPASRENFRMRRLEFKLSGTAVENTRWWTMVDFAKTPGVGTPSLSDNKVLQDLAVAFTLPYGFEVAMGQMKQPSTIEGEDSSGGLSTPERSLIARYYGERRDAGAMLTFKQAGEGTQIKASGMISNGSNPTGSTSTNQNESNNFKDTTGRIEAVLFDKMLTFGVFSGSGLYGAVPLHRGYLGGDVRFYWERLTATLLGASGKVADKDNFGTSFSIEYRFSDDISTVARTESFVDKTNFEDPSTANTLGLNYFFKGSSGTKLQLSYSVLKSMNGSYGTYVPGTKDADEAVTVLMLQTAI